MSSLPAKIFAAPMTRCLVCGTLLSVTCVVMASQLNVPSLTMAPGTVGHTGGIGGMCDFMIGLACHRIEEGCTLDHCTVPSAMEAGPPPPVFTHVGSTEPDLPVAACTA